MTGHLITDLGEWIDHVEEATEIDASGARQILEKIAASHAELLAACELTLDLDHAFGVGGGDAIFTDKQRQMVLAAVNKAKGESQ